MKTKYIAIIASAALITFIAGCGSGDEEQATSESQSEMMGTMDGSMAAAMENLKAYPLEVCLNSGEALDSMGGPVTAVYQGQEFKLCCEDCLKEFNEDKDAYMTKLMSKMSEAGISLEGMKQTVQPGEAAE